MNEIWEQGNGFTHVYTQWDVWQAGMCISECNGTGKGVGVVCIPECSRDFSMHPTEKSLVIIQLVVDNYLLYIVNKQQVLCLQCTYKDW